MNTPGELHSKSILTYQNIVELYGNQLILISTPPKIDEWESLRNQISFDIYIRESNKFIGSVYLQDITSMIPEIGIWLVDVEKYGRQWYATEAYGTVLDWVHDNLLEVDFVRHSCKLVSVPSVKLAERYQGVLKDSGCVGENGEFSVYYVPIERRRQVNITVTERLQQTLATID